MLQTQWSVKSNVLRTRSRAGPQYLSHSLAHLSHSLQVTAQKRIIQSQVSFSSSGFVFNGSRLLGISTSGVPVFERCVDSYQESEEKTLLERSSISPGSGKFRHSTENTHLSGLWPHSTCDTGMDGCCASSFSFCGKWHFPLLEGCLLPSTRSWLEGHHGSDAWRWVIQGETWQPDI